MEKFQKLLMLEKLCLASADSMVPMALNIFLSNLNKLTRLLHILCATFHNILCLVKCLFVPKIKNTLMNLNLLYFSRPMIAWRHTVLPTFGLFCKTQKLVHAGSQIRVNARTGSYHLLFIAQWILSTFYCLMYAVFQLLYTVNFLLFTVNCLII